MDVHFMNPLSESMGTYIAIMFVLRFLAWILIPYWSYRFLRWAMKGI